MVAKICPKCGIGFEPGISGVNLVAITLRRCPHCKKWVNINKAASAREREEEPIREPLSEEEILKQRIERSKRE